MREPFLRSPTGFLICAHPLHLWIFLPARRLVRDERRSGSGGSRL